MLYFRWIYPVFVDLKVKSHVPIQRQIIALSLMLSKFLSVDHIKGLVSGLSVDILDLCTIWRCRYDSVDSSSSRYFPLLSVRRMACFLLFLFLAPLALYWRYVFSVLTQSWKVILVIFLIKLYVYLYLRERPFNLKGGVMFFF